MEKEKKEVNWDLVKLIQSRCVHRRMGIATKGNKRFLYCQDCQEEFPDREIRNDKEEKIT